MTTIVMNTQRSAVTEYDWSFQSLTATHAASPAGLFTLGGETDATANITGEVRTGLSLWNSDRRKAVEDVYFAVRGSGAGVCRIETPATAYEYPVTLRANGLSRADTGRGISENYIGVGYRNVAGADFRLDRIDVGTVQSKQRSL